MVLENVKIKKDVSGLIYGLIKKVNLLEKRIVELETSKNSTNVLEEKVK